MKTFLCISRLTLIMLWTCQVILIHFTKFNVLIFNTGYIWPSYLWTYYVYLDSVILVLLEKVHNSWKKFTLLLNYPFVFLINSNSHHEIKWWVRMQDVEPVLWHKWVKEHYCNQTYTWPNLDWVDETLYWTELFWKRNIDVRKYRSVWRKDPQRMRSLTDAIKFFFVIYLKEKKGSQSGCSSYRPWRR